MHELRSPEDIEAVEIARVPLWTDARRESGPFDIIGDVHGCADELEELLAKLGYILDTSVTDTGELELPRAGQQAGAVRFSWATS